MRAFSLLFAAGTALLTAAAFAETTAPQASIPFANTTGIQGWRAVNDHTLYIHSLRGKWYRADLFGPCFGLQFDPTIGFVVRFGSTFDRTSSVLVEGHECKVSSLVEVSGPPKEGSGSAATERPAQSAQSTSTGANGASASPKQGNTSKSEGSAMAHQRPESRIPFADIGGIRDWRAVDDQTLYVQGRNDQWFRAKLFAPCQGLPFDTTIGFVVEPTGSFDRFSSILVDGHECPLASLTKAAAPPGRRNAEAPAPAQR